MKLHVIALALMISAGPPLAFAQSSGGSAGSPRAGSAGAGTLGTNGIPPGPANAAGQTNAGNDPSGSGNAPHFSPGTTTGLANPAPASPSNGSVSNSSPPPRGTNAAGTAKASGIGGGGTLRSNGTRIPGPNAPTTRSERDTDAQFRAENERLSHALNSICRGC